MVDASSSKIHGFKAPMFLLSSRSLSLSGRLSLTFVFPFGKCISGSIYHLVKFGMGQTKRSNPCHLYFSLLSTAFLGFVTCVFLDDYHQVVGRVLFLARAGEGEVILPVSTAHTETRPRRLDQTKTPHTKKR